MDLREPEVLLAWQAVMARLEAHDQSDGVAALLLKDCDAEPKPVETRPLLRQVESRLPMLISSTRQLDVSGAVLAALPLIGAGPGSTPSWDDFLMGYLCGLRTSPLLDTRCRWFLQEFGDAIAATSMRSTSASQTRIERTVHGDGPAWVGVVLEAIGYGSTALSMLLAERAMNTGHASDTDAIFGALLGGVLWQDFPYESELIDRLCGCAAHALQPEGATQ